MNSEIKDKRLLPVFGTTVSRILNNVETALVDQNLIDENGDPLPPLTQSGVEVLIQNLGNAIHIQFAHMEVHVPPRYSLDEVDLTDHFTDGTGVPSVELTDRKTLKLNFPGQTPLIRSMEVPLDVSEAQTLGTFPSGTKFEATTDLGDKHTILTGPIMRWPTVVRSQSGKL